MSGNAALNILAGITEALAAVTAVVFVAWACASVRARNRRAAAHWKSVMDAFPECAGEMRNPHREETR